MITVMPKHEDLKEALIFQASELKKYFRMGDHVKVLAGNYMKYPQKLYLNNVFIYFCLMFIIFLIFSNQINNKINKYF